MVFCQQLQNLTSFFLSEGNLETLHESGKEGHERTNHNVHMGGADLSDKPSRSPSPHKRAPHGRHGNSRHSRKRSGSRSPPRRSSPPRRHSLTPENKRHHRGGSLDRHHDDGHHDHKHRHDPAHHAPHHNDRHGHGTGGPVDHFSRARSDEDYNYDGNGYDDQATYEVNLRNGNYEVQKNVGGSSEVAGRGRTL